MHQLFTCYLAVICQLITIIVNAYVPASQGGFRAGNLERPGGHMKPMTYLKQMPNGVWSPVEELCYGCYGVSCSYHKHNTNATTHHYILCS